MMREVNKMEKQKYNIYQNLEASNYFMIWNCTNFSDYDEKLTNGKLYRDQ